MMAEQEQALVPVDAALQRLPVMDWRALQLFMWEFGERVLAVWQEISRALQEAMPTVDASVRRKARYRVHSMRQRQSKRSRRHVVRWAEMMQRQATDART